MKHYSKLWIIILCLVLAFVLVVLKVGNGVTLQVQAQLGERDNLPTIVIDPGHGGEDGGASSPTGLLEKDVNLSVARYLETLFLQSGFNVRMIRDSDNAIYDDTAKTLRQKKISDLHNRADIVNSDDNNILISIHQNNFEYSKYKGTQVFYSVYDTESKELAESIRLAVKDLIQNDNDRKTKPAASDIYLLNNVTVPAVLVECGFFSNPEEAALLHTETYKQKIAFSIYLGFINYYNSINY